MLIFIIWLQDIRHISCVGESIVSKYIVFIVYKPHCSNFIRNNFWYAMTYKSFIFYSCNAKLVLYNINYLIHAFLKYPKFVIFNLSVYQPISKIFQRGHRLLQVLTDTVYWKTRTRTPDNGRRTPDKRWKRRTTMEKTDNDGKDGQTMEKTDKRWKRRTNDGKDGQTMEKTDNDGKDGQRWKRRTNDGKDGQTMEKTDKRWKRRTTMEKTDNDGKDGQTMEKTRFLIDRPFMNISAQMSVFVIFTAIFTVIFSHCGRA